MISPKFRFYLNPLVSAALLSVSVLVPFLSFLSWFAFVPLLITVSQTTPLRSFLSGLLVSVIFFACLLYWILYYEFRILVIVIILAAPFFGILTFITNWALQNFRNALIHVFALPLAWAAVCFLYSLTPLEIIGNQIAFLQAPLFPQIVRIAGLFGFTFLVLTVNSLLAYFMQTRKKIFGAGILLIGILLSFSALPVKYPVSRPIKVALVQHNFPIELEWRFEHFDEVLGTYQRSIKENRGAVDLVVFPQFDLPIDILSEPELILKPVQEAKTPAILGTYIPKEPGYSILVTERFNAALLFSPNGQIQTYRAVTPPPFREISQVTGKKRETLNLALSLSPPLLKGGGDKGEGVKIGVMLCYENTRPQEGTAWAKNGAEILFSISNPGHFLGTQLPLYHLVHDQIRAMEIGKFIVRVSPNGYSAIVDPSGKIVIKSKLGEAVTLKGEVYPLEESTPFTKIGAIFSLALVLICSILFLVYAWRAWMIRFARKTR